MVRTSSILQIWVALTVTIFVATGIALAGYNSLVSTSGTPSSLNTLEEIQYWSNRDITWFAIKLSEDVNFSRASLTSPDRIYFDLFDTSLAPQLKKQIAVNDPRLRGVRVAQNTHRIARVVFDLNEVVPENHFVVTDPFRLVVGFGVGASVESFRTSTHRANVSTPSAIAEVSGVHTLATLEFTEVQIDWAGNSNFTEGRLTGPDRLYIDLLNTKMSDSLGDREFTVGDSRLSKVRVGQHTKDTARVVFDLEDNVTYDLTRTSSPQGLRVILRQPSSEIEVAVSEPVGFGSGPTATPQVPQIPGDVPQSRPGIDPPDLSTRPGGNAPTLPSKETVPVPESQVAVEPATNVVPQPPVSGNRGVVRGVLYNRQGQPATEADLILVNLDTAREATANTNSKGVFRLSLAPGDYRIYQSTPRGRTFLQDMLISTDEVQRLALRIPTRRESSLAAIEEFDVTIPGGNGGDSQSLADLINPFQSRKQGRLFGSVYEFHRNDNLDARNFFDPVGQPLPEYKRNQFGITLASLITQNMTLQGSYDGLRIIQGSTHLSLLPTPEMKLGDFSGLDYDIIDPLTGEPFPGNIIPQERISPVAQRLMAAIPNPNRDDPSRNYVNNAPVIENQDEYSFRFDYRPHENSTLNMDYQLTDSDDVRIADLPGFESLITRRSQYADISYNRALSGHLIAYGSVDFRRTNTSILAPNSGKSGLLNSFGINGIGDVEPIEEGYPAVSLSGYMAFGDRTAPDTSIRNRWSLDGFLTYSKGSHTLRAGTEFHIRQLNNDRTDGYLRGLFYFSGLFSDDSFGDFLLGYPDTSTRGVGSDRADLRSKGFELFFSDSWKISPKVSLTAGIQYNYFQPYYSVLDKVSGFYPLLFEPPVDGEIVIAGTTRAEELGFGETNPRTLVHPDRNNWAPRFGFAYNPFGRNQLVVRGSYSVYYDHVSDVYYARALTRNTPFFYTERVDSSPGIPQLTLEDPFEGGAIPQLLIEGIEPYFRIPYLQNWQLSVQNYIGRQWILRLSYAGRKGNKLHRNLPANVPLPGPGSVDEKRPNPNYSRFRIVSNGGRSLSNELDIALERRFSGGFSFRSGFEWHRLFDDDYRSYPSNPRNIRAEWARSETVRGRTFVTNYIFDLPFGGGRRFFETQGWKNWIVGGWRMSGITRIMDGRPFTVGVRGDPNNDGLYGDRPDRIGSGLLPSSERSIDKWFNTADFVEPDTFEFGNSGRNILLSPSYYLWDISLIKQTPLSDGDFLEFRLELFNAFNQVNFYRPSYSLGTNSFGKIFGAYRSREIELALKYSF